MISNRIKNLQPSPTLSLDAKVKELQGKGIKIINLGLGEPDFFTPKNISDAGIQAINDGFTHYTATAGIAPLKEAIVDKFKNDNELTYALNEVVVGVGAKQLLYNAFQTLCNEGDEVIVCAPTWSTYIEQIKLASGKPILVHLDPPFKLKCQDIEPHLTDKTKIIILNNPCNPTGATIDRDELAKIAKLAIEKNLFIVSDEVYEKIFYGEKPVSIITVDQSIKNRAIIVNALSKPYAMTGWRVGYAAGPKEIIDGMVAMQSQTTSNTCSIAQKAAVEALGGNQDSITMMLDEFTKRRKLLINALSEIKGLEFNEPEGAFYFFVSVKKLLNDKYPTSKEWCAGLLETKQVAVVPGEAFECLGYFRLSFAASESDLIKGVSGIREFI